MLTSRWTSHGLHLFPGRKAIWLATKTAGSVLRRDAHLHKREEKQKYSRHLAAFGHKLANQLEPSLWSKPGKDVRC